MLNRRRCIVKNVKTDTTMAMRWVLWGTASPIDTEKVFTSQRSAKQIGRNPKLKFAHSLIGGFLPELRGRW